MVWLAGVMIWYSKNERSRTSLFSFPPRLAKMENLFLIRTKKSRFQEVYYHRLLSDPLEDEDAYRQLSPQQPRPSSKSSSPELSSRVFSPELGLPSSSVTYPTPPVLSSGSVSRDQSPSSSLSKLPGLSSQGTREELNGYLAALLDEGVYDDIDNDDYGKENSGEGTLEEEEVTVVQETVRDEETAYVLFKLCRNFNIDRDTLLTDGEGLQIAAHHPHRHLILCHLLWPNFRTTVSPILLHFHRIRNSPTMIY